MGFLSSIDGTPLILPNCHLGGYLFAHDHIFERWLPEQLYDRHLVYRAPSGAEYQLIDVMRDIRYHASQLLVSNVTNIQDEEFTSKLKESKSFPLCQKLFNVTVQAPNSLFFKDLNGTLYPLHTPPQFAAGTSVSHFTPDYGHTPNFLMAPSVVVGNHPTNLIGPALKSALVTLGWPVKGTENKIRVDLVIDRNEIEFVEPRGVEFVETDLTSGSATLSRIAMLVSLAIFLYA